MSLIFSGKTLANKTGVEWKTRWNIENLCNFCSSWKCTSIGRLCLFFDLAYVLRYTYILCIFSAAEKSFMSRRAEADFAHACVWTETETTLATKQAELLSFSATAKRSTLNVHYRFSCKRVQRRSCYFAIGHFYFCRLLQRDNGSLASAYLCQSDSANLLKRCNFCAVALLLNDLSQFYCCTYYLVSMPSRYMQFNLLSVISLPEFTRFVWVLAICFGYLNCLATFSTVTLCCRFLFYVAVVT